MANGTDVNHARTSLIAMLFLLQSFYDYVPSYITAKRIMSGISKTVIQLYAEVCVFAKQTDTVKMRVCFIQSANGTNLNLSLLSMIASFFSLQCCYGFVLLYITQCTVVVTVSGLLRTVLQACADIYVFQNATSNMTIRVGVSQAIASCGFECVLQRPNRSFWTLSVESVTINITWLE